MFRFEKGCLCDIQSLRNKHKTFEEVVMGRSPDPSIDVPIIELLKGGRKEELLSTLRDLGFSETKKALRNMEGLLERIGEEGLERAMEAILSSPYPERALNGMEQVVSCLDRDLLEALPEKEGAFPVLATVTALSPFLTAIIVRHPDFLAPLLIEGELEKRKDRDAFLRDLKALAGGSVSIDELSKALRVYRQREFLRIGTRDLMGLAPFEEVGAELADLASASLEVALRFCLEELKKRYGRPVELLPDGSTKEAEFTILGMGKLGGRELNFSSDIDIIYLYSSDKGETEGVGEERSRVTLHTFFVKLSEMITRLIGRTTEEGFVFRVDLDLRPEGKNGDLASSLRSMEIYYESWGQTWERAAMIKARPVAGSMELGEAFLRMIEPFVYRRYLDFTAIDEIKGMKERIDLTLLKKGEGIDVKLGRGGIREIEFFVQAIQLIKGGRDPAIRERNTLKALERLVEGGHITEEEGAFLRDAYTFLRTVEHRVQIIHGRQTHTLPADERELSAVERGLGLTPSGGRTLTERLKETMEGVHGIYEKLFYEPSKALEREVPRELLAVFEEAIPEDEALEVLGDCGFKDQRGALAKLRLLREGPPFAHYSMRARVLLKKIAPFLFSRIVSSPDPDMALTSMEKFITTIGARATLLSLLAENREVMEILVDLFGTSSFLSRFLIEHPEIVDSFITEDMGRAIKTREEMEGELEAALEGEGDYEEVLNAMRRYRNTEILRIGVNDIKGRIGPEDVSLQITSLADLCLQKAFEIAWKDLTLRYGEPLTGDGKGASFAILGMGKLGGTELIYGSDLDVIFVYSREGETKGPKVISGHEFFAKLAQRIISIISINTSEGYLFKVDTRLRPSGSAGPIVTSLKAFTLYHEERAQVWERQALLKVRFAAGHRAFGREAVGLARELILQRPLTREDELEINRLRMRMERELAGEDEERLDIKLGTGGMVDIEFTVQLLQLRHGRERRHLLEPNTLKALGIIEGEGLLDPGRCSTLREAYRFFRRVENRLRIVEDRGESVVSFNDPDLPRLVRALGYRDGRTFFRECRARKEAVREVYREVFGL